MAFNPDFHRRKSIRLPNYNYSRHGAYFITVCTQNREQMFGHIMGEEMHLNNTGQIIQQVWDELQVFYPNIGTDEFIIMPDHIHGIIMVGAAPCGRPDV
jgi:REP element-mobilizing transposase RayT